MKIENKTFGEERALYNLKNSTVAKCRFAGMEDGESALKECRDFIVEDCDFYLRYPLWHGINFEMSDSRLYDTCRAAMWYDRNARLVKCSINGIKACRECKNLTLADCDADSPEFGWKCDGVTVTGGHYVAEYFMFESSNITLTNVEFTGKYSFQYVQNAKINDCVLDTKDAFWHAKNVTVRNSVVKGEYLAWYSENVTFIDCTIVGTQPLCYCKGLTLINCKTEGCDLAFEYSDVKADIVGRIESVKNPLSGEITADEIGETVLENSVADGKCVIKTRK